MNWLSLIAGICYVVLGIIIIVNKFFLVPIEVTIAYPLGAVMIIYGLFRVYRAGMKFKKSDDEI